MKRRCPEQSGYLGGKGRVQIAIRHAKDDRDRDLEASDCTTVDELVLSYKSFNRPAVQARIPMRASDCSASPKNWGRID